MFDGLNQNKIEDPFEEIKDGSANPINDKKQESALIYSDKIKSFQEQPLQNLPIQNNKKSKLFFWVIFVFVFLILIVVAIFFLNKYQIIKFGKPQENVLTNTTQESDKITNENTGNNQEGEAKNDVVKTEVAENELSDTEGLIDSDEDGFLDVFEGYYDTDINNSDSDGDGYLDGEEVLNNYNPNGADKLNDKKNIFYFAYGSNMNLDGMRSRCGDNSFVGFKNFYLNDYSFYFFQRGVANIKYLQNSRVYGVLYKINNECLSHLDSYESYPGVYNRKEFDITNGAKSFKTFIYIVENESTIGSPSNEYYKTIIDGAKQFSIPESHINYIMSLKNADNQNPKN